MNGIIYKIKFLILLFSISINPQQGVVNEYGLYLIDDIETYTRLVEEDSSKLLINLEEFIDDIVLDIRYATVNNFSGEAVYDTPQAYARLPVAEALKNIQEELKKENLGLKIFDAYRPYSVTVKFYEIVGDPDFVATPEKGSRHNRGCAVDLTIIDLKTGKELIMPTGYDDFTEKAAHNYNKLPDEAIQNREKLKNIMVKNGFSVYKSEWWHYDFNGWESFELMDIEFEELEKSEEKIN